MNLAEFDKKLKADYGIDTLIGVDEAGRGPLAGPVIACACVVEEKNYPLLNEVNDSKKISPIKREKLFELIAKCGISYALGSACAAEIDRINILQATFNAMRRAVLKLAQNGKSLAVIDGNKTVPDLDIRQRAIIKGDGKSLSVAAASIIAKVIRDREMCELDKKYPHYGFARHKGYGTSAHFEILMSIGPCPQHRRTFIPVRCCAGMQSRVRTPSGFSLRKVWHA